MLWMAILLMTFGLVVGHLAHQRYQQQREHQHAAVTGLLVSEKTHTIIEGLILAGCQIELLHYFNAYLTLHLAAIMTLYPQHRPARTLAEKALLMAELSISPTPQLATSNKTHKAARKSVYQARQLLPNLVQCGILRKKQLRQWQIYLHHLLLEFELSYHYSHIQKAHAAKQSAAAAYHTSQAESLLKKTPFMDPVLQKNWLVRLADSRGIVSTKLIQPAA